METNTCRIIRFNGLIATLEVKDGGYLLRTLSNQTGATTSITIPLDDNRTTQYTLRPFQKLVIYPPVGVTGKIFTASGMSN